MSIHAATIKQGATSTKEYLRQRYIVEGWSSSQIAEELKIVTSVTVRNYLKRYGIPLRPRGGAHTRPVKKDYKGHNLEHVLKVLKHFEFNTSATAEALGGAYPGLKYYLDKQRLDCLN